MPPIENIKNALFLLIVAGAAHLLVGAFAADESLAAAQHDDEAISTRDIAARKVCQGRAFEWQGDVLTCFKELP